MARLSATFFYGKFLWFLRTIIFFCKIYLTLFSCIARITLAPLEGLKRIIHKSLFMIQRKFSSFLLSLIIISFSVNAADLSSPSTPDLAQTDTIMNKMLPSMVISMTIERSTMHKAAFIFFMISLSSFASYHFWTYAKGPGSVYHWTHGKGPGSYHHWTYGKGHGSYHHWTYGKGMASNHHWTYGKGAGSNHHWIYGKGMGSNHHWTHGTGPGTQTFWQAGKGPSLVPIEDIGKSFIFEGDDIIAVLDVIP